MQNTRFPLHPSQQDVFLDQLVNLDSPRYNTGGYLKIIGNLNLEKFIEATYSCTEVFDALRMRFDFDRDELSFTVDDDRARIEIELIDFTDREFASADALSWAKEQFNIPFSFRESGPLARHAVLMVAENEFWFFFKYHHLINDGFGFSVLFHYVAKKYLSLIAEDGAGFEYPSYIAEAVRAAGYAASESYRQEGEFWKEKIIKNPERLFYKEKGRLAGGKSQVFIYTLSVEERKSLVELEALTQAGIQQLTIAALIIFFGKTRRQIDFVFGTSIHKRTSRTLRNMVGMFTGILPFKGTYQEELSLNDFIREIVSSQRKDYRHQNYLIGDLNRYFKNNASGDYLVQVIVNYELFNFELDFGPAVESVMHDLSSDFETDPLRFGWRDFGKNQSLELHVNFQADYFDRSEIELFVQRLFFIFGQFRSKLALPVKDVAIVPPAESLELLTHGCGSFSGDTFVLREHLRSVMAAESFRPAVRCGERVMSYGLLGSVCEAVSVYLRGECGLVKGDRVVVMIPRTEWVPVVFLSLLDSGLVYIPVDMNYPADRIRFLLEDVSPRLVICTAESSELLAVTEKYPVLLLTALEEFTSSYAGGGFEGPDLEAADTAYIIYTSGSTGLPKGVLVSHGNLGHFLGHVYRQYVQEAGMVMPFIASSSFDISVFQLLFPLLRGGISLIVDKSELQDLEKFTSLLRSATVLDTVPGVYALLADYILEHGLSGSFGHIERLFIGGDSIPDSLLLKLSSVFSSACITVTYGPTEGTIFCTDLVYTAGTPGPLSRGSMIGHPISGSRIYILGNDQELLPAGVDGEICIGGAGVTQGYFQRPEQTLSRFVEHKEYGLLYRTGDIGRWSPEWVLEFRGRNDGQVKIRGHRIELGEIENKLQESGLCRQSVVLSRADAHGNKMLVGYVVPDGPFDRDGLMTYLERKLPEYMIPSLLIALKDMPLTPNGKIDRKSLPDVDALLGENAYMAPRTEAEAALAVIWEDLLRVERVGVNDNFFELGGDSIITIQVVSRAKRSGYNIQIKDIFRHQTIARLVAALNHQEQGESCRGEQGLLSGRSGLLPVQQMYLEHAEQDSPYFNQSLLLGIDKKISAPVIREAVSALVRHHDALRFVYSKEGAEWQQSYGPEAVGTVVTEQISATLPELFGVIVSDVCKGYQQSLSMGGGELIRVVLLETDKRVAQNRLLIVIHHLAVDGVSWRILLSDLEQLLSGIMRNEYADLGLKSSSVRQWYAGLQHYGSSARLKRQKGYWENITGQYRPLMTDTSYQGRVTTGDTAAIRVSLSAGDTRSLLQEAPRAYHTEVNDLLLCALVKTFCDWNKSDQLHIGLEGHGREDDILAGVESSRTVGWLTNLYPVLLQLNGAQSVGSCIKEIKEQLRRVPDKGMGYGVLKYINKEPGLGESTPWNVVFNYLGQLDTLLEGDGTWLSRVDESPGRSISAAHEVDEKFVINSMIRNGALEISWGYSTLHYTSSTATELASAYVQNLELLIMHCRSQAVSVPTPSDYGLGQEISYKELDAFLDLPQSKGIGSIYRLSGLQEGMLFHSLYDQQAGGYVEQFVCDLYDTDVAIFHKSWNILLSRHSALRSTFHPDTFSIPVQCVHLSVTLPLEVLDYRHLSEGACLQAIEEYESADLLKGIDLGSAPVMRISLFRMDESRYRMLWTHHHLLTDGWSLPVLMGELLNTYEQLHAGEEPPILEGDNYEDYIRYIEHRDKYEEESYWRGYLSGLEESSLLPFIGTTADRNKGIGSYAEETLVVEAALREEIAGYAQQHRLTLNTVMQGVWSYLLYRYTGNAHITYGVTVSGRPDDLADIEQRVGMYINTLPLHAFIDEDEGISGWLEAIQQGQLQSREYQYTSLSDIQRWIGLPGDLFDSLLVFENYPVDKVLSDKTWSLRMEKISAPEKTNYPLCITVNSSSEISISFSYNTTLLGSEEIRRIKGHFAHILMQLPSPDKVKLGDLQLLTPEEETALAAFNDTDHDYPSDKTIVDLFDEQVKLHPEAIAVRFGDHSLSYHELHTKANHIASCLQNDYQVQSKDLVGLVIHRSEMILAGIFGILKAGAAYVPIDPGLPRERIAYMLNDTGIKVLILQPEDADFPGRFGFEGAVLDMELFNQKGYLPSPSLTAVSPIGIDDPAYVIYTSGSTGRPKGVVIPHQGVVNLSHWQAAQFDVKPGKNILQFFSYSFDGAVGETFMALLNGATLKMFNTEKLDPDYLTDFINREDISVGVFVPTLLKQIDPENLSLIKDKWIVSVGEECPVDLADKWSSLCRFVNAYGPTEYTVYSHLYEMQSHNVVPVNQVPIGKPIFNSKSYILDHRLRQVPVGVPGEIYISGMGMAKGYLRNNLMSLSHFLPNPFTLSAKCTFGEFSEPASVRSDIERFKERKRHSGFAEKIFKVDHFSDDDLSAFISKLDADLIFLSQKYLNNLESDREKYKSFKRYMLEGVHDTYASCGINEEVLRTLLPFENYNRLKGVDLGFGNGEVMEILGMMGTDTIGIELSPFSVQRARDAGFAAYMGEVDLDPADFCDQYGINAGSMDFAISNLVLDRVSNPLNYIRNLVNVLKTGGRFALQTLLPVVPVDDGETDKKIIYTSPENRVTLGNDAQEDTWKIVQLLCEVGGLELKIFQVPFVVSSRDGMQEYKMWSFSGLKGAVPDVKHQMLGCFYKTGDYGFYDKEGRIYFKGRLDDQVKIRGFRIELGEIEEAIRRHGYIQDVVVVAFGKVPGGKTLIAYVVAVGGFDKESLMLYLRGKLPEYMVPAAIVELDRMPLTSSGKIDKRSLPDPDLGSLSGGDYVAPRTGLEQTLAEIWQDLLGVERIGIHDDFFELGGHSLLATRIVSAIRKKIEVEFAVRTFFQLPTIGLMAQYISVQQHNLILEADDYQVIKL